MTRTLLLAPLALLAACGSPVSVEPVLVVVNISPPGGAAMVSVHTDVVVTFNHTLDATTATTAHAWLEDDLGDVVPGDLSWDAGTMSLTLAPAVILEGDSTYEVVLTPGLESESAGALAAEVRSDFTTVTDTEDNLLPLAEAGEYDPVDLGEVVHLDGSDSYDPEGEALGFTWWVESTPLGSSAVISDPGVVDPTFSPDVAGEYVVGLVVDDGEEDSSPDYALIEAVEAP